MNPRRSLEKVEKSSPQRQKTMKSFLILLLTTTLLFPTPSQSDPYHFGEGGVFELDLGDSEIPLTPKQEREQKLLEE
jgi:hypothetical protein